MESPIQLFTCCDDLAWRRRRREREGERENRQGRIDKGEERRKHQGSPEGSKAGQTGTTFLLFVFCA
jgi:hypothetical protein